MHDASIIPDDSVADPPFMAIDEFRSQAVFEKRIQELLALRFTHPFDMRGVSGIDE